MTRLEILNLKYDQLKAEDNSLELRINKIYTRQKNEQTLILKKYIDTFDGFKVNFGDSQVSVNKKDSNYSVLDMYVSESWVGDERAFSRIDFSTSSFRTEFGKGNDMRFAEERFKMLSFYSQTLADFADDILAEFNTLNKRYSDLLSTLYELKRPLRKKLGEISEMISKVEDENMMDKLMSKDGLMIEPEEGEYLPRFQVKFDWELSSVKSIRGIKKSSSGKSVDLEVAVRRGYGQDKKLEVIEVDRVRFDNVKSFINRNKNLIANG